MASVYVLIPVHNRLQHTTSVVECLRRQDTKATINIVIIDDGSTDKTAEYLAAQPDVVSLHGDGSLFWGGAMQMGLRYALDHCDEGDYILFLNNDTEFAPDYIHTLMCVSVTHNGAIVGSMIHEAGRQPPLVSIGARININKMRVVDIIDQLPESERSNIRESYFPDALSGRGTLFPAEMFRKHGLLRARLLPHYFGDYEISMRFKRNGACLVVNRDAFVVSPPVYGNAVAGMGVFQRYFSYRSSRYLPHLLAFFCLVGTPSQRLTAPLRFSGKTIWHAFKRLNIL